MLRLRQGIPAMKRGIVAVLGAGLAIGVMVLVGMSGLGDAKPQVGSAPASGLAKAVFAGGCFWCMEPPFEKLDGVKAVVSGYIGGTKQNPTYEEVSSGSTGHAESIEVTYDPRKLSYERLLQVFWHNIDPTSANGQFCDRGKQYRSAIFYLDETQKRLAEQSKTEIERSKRFPEPIVTEIVAATRFYPAEEYHQDFYRKNPIRYYSYRIGCGRDRRLTKLWGQASGH